MAASDQPVKHGRGRPKGPTPEYFRRREEIVATAIEIFRVSGDASVTLREVGGALGLDRASVYHYVESKGHLLSLVCERVVEAATRDAIDQVARATDPAERLVAAIRIHVGAIAEQRHVFRIFFDDRGVLSEDDRAKIQVLEQRYVAMLTETVAAAIGAGVLPSTDPRQAALAIIGLTSWLYKWFDPDRDDPESYAAVCLALLRQKHARARVGGRKNSAAGR